MLARPLSLSLALVLAAVALPPLAPQAEAKTYVILSPGFFWDDGDRVEEERKSIQLRQVDQGFSSDGFFQLSAYGLTDMGKNIRLGGGIRYFTSYGTVDDPEGDDEPPDPVELGTLLELVAQADWALTLAKDPAIDLLLGLQMGMVMLLPSGQLEEEIKALSNQGVSTGTGPRLGYTVGPQVGGRWQVNKWFGVRLDFAIRWSQTWIFDLDEQVGSVPFALFRRLDVIRYELAVALEAGF